MRSPNYFIATTAAAFLLANGGQAAVADTSIKGEFEYSLDEQQLSEWQIGPAFELNDATELEIPIGQEDNLWLVRPEFTYEIETNDRLVFEFSVGVEARFVGEPIEGFGGIEGRIDF